MSPNAESEKEIDYFLHSFAEIAVTLLASLAGINFSLKNSCQWLHLSPRQGILWAKYIWFQQSESYSGGLLEKNHRKKPYFSQ